MAKLFPIPLLHTRSPKVYQYSIIVEHKTHMKLSEQCMYKVATIDLLYFTQTCKSTLMYLSKIIVVFFFSFELFA